MPRPAAWILGVSLTLGACSFEPRVGPLLRDGAAAPACTLGASGYATSYGSPSGQALSDAFCTADGGTLQSDCDTCEATSCCAQRVACYADETCACADVAVSMCTAAITDAGSASSAILACWGAFARSGSLAATRYACLRASCAAACGIPN